ncbi:MAG: hypothetical protein B7Z55_07395, partial [Planctomycetales bacterium 12-60-4]
PTLAVISAEIESLSEELRVPPAANPYVSEPELAAALDRAANLAHESPAEPTQADPHSLPVDREIETRVLGQYRLLEKLGAGGMGTVYRAVHNKLNRTVALKVLPSDRFQSPDAIARFEREMRAVGMLQHPNIVAAHDAGEVDGTHFLVMEYVDGEDVGELLARTGPFPIAEACEIARQAALGLQHICDFGQVHRDIKPSNLMLAAPKHRSGSPTVKILDLGLALLEPTQLGTHREITSTGQVMGTIDYMAPEQGLDTHSVDIRADLYSLGATLYKLLTGRAPLENPQHNSVMKRLIALDRDQPPPLSSLRPECPPALCDLVHRLLAKSPDDRPEQPQAVAEELAPFAAGADLRALLEGTAETLKRWRESQPDSATATVTTSKGTPTQIAKPSAMATAQPPVSTQRNQRWLWGASLPVVLLLGVLIYVVTDNGQVTIEAPDDLKDGVSVSILRNGAPLIENWSITPGINQHQIRTGSVEVRLSANPDDEFGLQPTGDLVVRRRGKVAYKLVRRPKPSPVAEAPESLPAPVDSASQAPQFALDFSNSALAFNGANDSVRLAATAEVPSGPITIDAWLKLPKTGRNEQTHIASFQFSDRLFSLLAKSHSANNGETSLLLDVFGVRDASGKRGEDCGEAIQVPTDRWIHVAATWSRDVFSLFIDGQRRQLRYQQTWADRKLDSSVFGQLGAPGP